jgi:hypothetical protein
MKTNICLYLLIFAMCATFAAAQALHPQNSAAPAAAATLSGRITGAPGVDVSDIEVYAVNTTSGDVRQTVTNAQGFYSFPNLTTGVTQQVSPARVGYGFSPAVRFVQHNGETTNVDFVAVPFASPGGGAANDFDGDGASDISVFRPSDATWYIAPSSQQENSRSGNSALTTAAPVAFTGVRWGLPTDVVTPADFDGDGKTDIAVWRPADENNPHRSYFYILNSSDNSVRAEQFGSPNDAPFLAGDWDGDAKADPAVYRPGTVADRQSYFFYRPSASPGVDFRIVLWGTAGDLPMRGDFDGDGKLDAAVFRPSDAVWYILQSSNNQPRYAHWGLGSDKFVPADYDADGKTDLAVFRDGKWYINQSSDNQPRYVSWGLATDAPVPADYDGDGKTDVAVNRDGAWYISESSSGQMRAARFGLPGDQPVPAAGFYNPNN